MGGIDGNGSPSSRVVPAPFLAMAATAALAIAHEDLNHVAKAQVRAAGLGIGAALIEQIFPGSGQVIPLAGELVTRKYSRDEEFAADHHGVELLERAGYNEQVMIDGLTWLIQVSGGLGRRLLCDASRYTGSHCRVARVALTHQDPAPATHRAVRSADGPPPQRVLRSRS